MSMNIKQAIIKVVSGGDLSEKEAYSVFGAIMSGRCTTSQISAFIIALRMKGETVDEITGAAKAMRKKALRVKTGLKSAVVDTCGTGGSGIGAFNVSTAAAFVAAGCGVKIAKHGNRSASSRSGSADVLEALGVNLDVAPRDISESIRSNGIGFLFAPQHHEAMRHAAVPRREIGVRTIFNILGPLSNPAAASAHVLGVFDGALTEVIAKVLCNLGVKRAFVVHGGDGLDEISISAKTKVSELKGRRVRTYFIDPAKFGLKRASIDSVKGGSASRNAGIIRGILSGKKGPGRDIVVMNASAAIVAAGKAENFRQAAQKAAQSIDSGKALEKLHRLIDFTNGKR